MFLVFVRELFANFVRTTFKILSCSLFVRTAFYLFVDIASCGSIDSERDGTVAAAALATSASSSVKVKGETLLMS